MKCPSEEFSIIKLCNDVKVMMMISMIYYDIDDNSTYNDTNINDEARDQVL